MSRTKYPKPKTTKQSYHMTVKAATTSLSQQLQRRGNIACLGQEEAESWSLSGAGQDTVAVQHRASAAGMSLHIASWWRLCDAGAHLCIGNTTTCCRAYRGCVQASALCTLSRSERETCTVSKYTVNTCSGLSGKKNTRRFLKEMPYFGLNDTWKSCYVSLVRNLLQNINERLMRLKLYKALLSEVHPHLVFKENAAKHDNTSVKTCLFSVRTFQITSLLPI